MKTVIALASAGFLLAPPIAGAQGVFAGTWRPDPQKFSPTRELDVFELANGTYGCSSCTPPYSVKADGLDQPVPGNPSYDTISIVIIDERTVLKIAKKSGHAVMEATVEVSPDGATQTERQTMYGMGPRPIEITGQYTRVAAGSKESHSISGSWRLTEADVSNHAEDTVFKVHDNTLSMSDLMGRSFTAKLDGTEAPYSGSDEFSSVSVKMIDKNTIEEADKNSGAVVKITRWQVAPDGRTIHARFDDTKGHVQEQTGHKVTEREK